MHESFHIRCTPPTLERSADHQCSVVLGQLLLQSLDLLFLFLDSLIGFSQLVVGHSDSPLLLVRICQELDTVETTLNILMSELRAVLNTFCLSEH